MTGPGIELKFVYDDEYTSAADRLSAAFAQMAVSFQAMADEITRAMSQIAAGILTKDEARARMGYGPGGRP